MVDGRRVYLNLTQEGRDDLDDLRQSGLLFGLKMSSVTYVSTVSFRPTPDGLRFLANRLREEDREVRRSPPPGKLCASFNPSGGKAGKTNTLS
jgi:hypothetical protein